MGVVHVEAFRYHSAQPADSTTAILPPHRCIEEPIVTALALGLNGRIHQSVIQLRSLT